MAEYVRIVTSLRFPHSRVTLIKPKTDGDLTFEEKYNGLYTDDYNAPDPDDDDLFLLSPRCNAPEPNGGFLRKGIDYTYESDSDCSSDSSSDTEDCAIESDNDKEGNKLSQPCSEMVSVHHQLKMLDPDQLREFARANVMPPEITSIIVFTIDGSVLAHSSTTSDFRELRRLATTCGVTFTSLQAIETTVSLEFESNIVLVTQIVADVLLGVVGPRQLEAEHQPSVNGITGEEKPASQGADDDEVQIDRVETSSSSTPNQDDGPQEPFLSPAVLAALEKKSDALTGFLKDILQDVRLPTDF